MVGAFAYDFYKNRAEMTTDHLGIIAIGFVVSFVTAIIVVKTFLSYVTRHGFTLFAWWRVIVGTLGLIALAMGSRIARRVGKALSAVPSHRNDAAPARWWARRRALCPPYKLRLTRSSSETARRRGSARDIAGRSLPSNPA